MFDRVTGQPVWPIEERPVPQSDVPGEKTSATQPFPPDALQYALNFLKLPDDLIDFTPELRQQALDFLKRYKVVPSPFARTRTRAKRETTGFKNVPDFPTAAAVAEGIHAAWYLIRDSCRSRENPRCRDSGGRSLRSDHRLPYETPPAS